MANKLNEHEQIPQEDDIALLKSRPDSSHSSSKIRIYVGVLIIIVILGIGSFFAIQNKQNNDPDNGIVTPASSSATQVAASHTVSSASTTVTVQPASGSKPASSTVTHIQQPTGGPLYYISIGIYDKDTAQAKSKQLTEKGYDITLYKVSGGTKQVSSTEYRVSVTYNDKGEAKSDLTILKARGYKSAQLISEGGKTYIRINSYDSKAKAESVKSDLLKLGYNAVIYVNTTTKTASTERYEMRAVGYTKPDGYEAMLRLQNAGYKDMKMLEQSK